MSKSIKNVELLLSEMSRTVCILSYDPKRWQERGRLKRELQKNGFQVFLATDKDKQMSEYYQYWINNSAQNRKKILLKKITSRLIIYGRNVYDSLHNRRTNEDRNVLFLLPDFEWGYQWLVEVVQAKLSAEKNVSKLFLYDSKWKKVIKPSKPVLGYFEYHVSWNCNLKCKGCSHYSNLLRTPLFGDYNSYYHNLLRLKELFSNVETIRLMGGEPFLNKEIGEFIRKTKKIFPDTDLRIVTNGLLIPKVDREVFEIIRAGGVTVDISSYPPTVKMRNEIITILKSEKLNYTFTPHINAFRFEVGEKRGDAKKHYHFCLTNCHFLTDAGRMGICGAPILYDMNRERLGTYRKVTKKDWINIYDVNDGYEMLRKFHAPIPYCAYCNTQSKIVFPWKGNYMKELTLEEISKV